MARLHMVHSAFTYDVVGRGYRSRRPDQRLADLLFALVGDASRVINVGAGTGAYEPVDRIVIAVEPSHTMIAQRPVGAAPVVRGVAERLPFADDTFDAAMAISTIHHWNHLDHGLRELQRVARKQIVYLSERARLGDYWLVDDYFPEIVNMPTNQSAPMASHVAQILGGNARVETFPVPADFTDGAGAFWARPEHYCDPEVQASLSMFALLDPAVVKRGTTKLRNDLASGRWDERHGHLRTQRTFDMGYRIVHAHR